MALAPARSREGKMLEGEVDSILMGLPVEEHLDRVKFCDAKLLSTVHVEEKMKIVSTLY